jgi:transcriptional regulator with XRE-family HTH domain
MNFGDKLKHIRTEKNLTQPQLADAIGIEQSYLSKLENDKSQPSAEMFSTIIKALDLDPKAFLGDIDPKVLQTSLRHIPEVSQFLNGTVTRRVHNAKKWLLGAAAACALGFALMLAANDGIFSPNNKYRYISKGVILKNESDQVFEQYRETLPMKAAADGVRPEEFPKLMADFQTNRLKSVVVETWGDRGSVYFENVDNGRRKFELDGVHRVRSTTNKLLQYLGALFAFCGVLAFVVEWRLRKANTGIQNEFK